MRRGEVWWYEPPDEDPRPYLILLRDEAVGLLSHLVAVPSTRTIRGIPSEVEIGPDDGMPDHCVLSLDNITVVEKGMLTERITTLGPDKVDAVCRTLQRATGC